MWITALIHSALSAGTDTTFSTPTFSSTLYKNGIIIRAKPKALNKWLCGLYADQTHYALELFNNSTYILCFQMFQVIHTCYFRNPVRQINIIISKFHDVMGHWGTVASLKPDDELMADLNWELLSSQFSLLDSIRQQLLICNLEKWLFRGRQDDRAKGRHTLLEDIILCKQCSDP